MFDGAGLRASVPGNLLICGEYIILEDGGYGISVATGPRAHGMARPLQGTDSSIYMITDAGSICLNCSMRVRNSPFIIKAYRTIINFLREAGHTPPVLEIMIDTTLFFQKTRKRGLGASAAATVILTALILASSMEPDELDKDKIAHVAILAHRFAQGKTGSGYDVFTSCYGSIGIFIGGDRPQWVALNKNHPLFSLQVYTFPGPKEVDSSWAANQYRKWRIQSIDQTEGLFLRSQKLIVDLRDSHDEDEVFRLITELRLLSTELGGYIGIESWISPPTAFYECSAWKGSGAGNELGILLLASDSDSQLKDPYSRTTIHDDGLQIFNSDGDLILRGS